MGPFLSEIYRWLGTVTGPDNLWIVEVFIVVFLTLVCAAVVRRFVDKLTKRSKLTKNLWDDSFFESLNKPLTCFIWVMGLSFAAAIVAKVSASAILDAVVDARRVAVIVIIAWFVNTFIRSVESHVVDVEYMKAPMDKTTAVALGKLLRVSVLITAFLIALQSMGYSISGVLAFGGIGGIAVGFAAKDLLANFFGGLMIYLDRPFSVGDWIRSPDKNIEGTVEDIGWRLTRIRTFDKRPLYVPNSTFTQIAVENPSRMLNRRIYETIGIRYDDGSKMDAVVNDVKNMLLTHDEIDTRQTIMVNFNSFNASSLDFFVYCFTKTTVWADFHNIKQDVMLKILSIIESHGAECAFPTSTLHIPNEVSLANTRPKAQV